MTLVVLVQLLLLAYHQFTTWFDLYPFNGVRFTKPEERRTEAAVNLILMGLPPIGFAFRIEALMTFGVVYYFILFAIECVTWWVPYAFGPSQKWLDIYHRIHRTTINVLPRRGYNPAPNVEHLILMVLTLAAAAITYRAFAAQHHVSMKLVGVGIAVGAFLVWGTARQLVGRAKAPSTAQV